MAATMASLLSLRPASLGNSSSQARRPARAAPLHRREGRSSIQPAHAALGAALDLGSSPSGLSQLATSLASTLAWAAAGYLLLQNLRLQAEEVDKQGKKECDSCGGTGLQECFCNRWSDNDVGCGSCGGSGKMRCNSCGGGGTAVPIEAKLYITSERKKNY